MIDNKVSIITPLFNCEKYLELTIRSVLSQTYDNWEMILIDDCSTDRSFEVAKNFSNIDERIKAIKLETNCGAAIARNKGLGVASGRFIAYLDADDLWAPTKLQIQVSFMIKNEYAFSCTSYEVIDDEGNDLNKIICMPTKLNYVGFLTNNLLQTVGIMADLSKINKNLLIMPDLRRRQDAATWLKVLKEGFDCYGIKEALAYYRRTKNSLSSDKIKAIKGVWYLYRKVEHLSLIFSCYCFIRYSLLAVWKRVYFRRNSK